MKSKKPVFVLLALATLAMPKTFVLAQSGGSLLHERQNTELSAEERAHRFLQSLDEQQEAARRIGQLADKQIEGFLTETEGRREDEKIVFSAFFSPRRLSPQEQRRYSRSGKIPFQILADYQEHRTDRNNRVSRRRLSGRVNFYVLDADGNVALDRQSSTVDRMHPV